jgi:hypothetical protein
LSAAGSGAEFRTEAAFLRGANGELSLYGHQKLQCSALTTGAFTVYGVIIESASVSATTGDWTDLKRIEITVATSGTHSLSEKWVRANGSACHCENWSVTCVAP